MKLGFEIVRWRKGKKASAYTVKLNGEEKTEFQKFLEDPLCTQSPDFIRLCARLNDALTRHGFEEWLFRMEESRLGNSVAAFVAGKKKDGKYPLRLYCCRWGTSIVILGYGGPKNVQRYQDDPRLHAAVQLMERVDRLLKDRIAAGEVSVGEDGYTGNLVFETEIDYD